MSAPSVARVATTAVLGPLDFAVAGLPSMLGMGPESDVGDEADGAIPPAPVSMLPAGGVFAGSELGGVDTPDAVSSSSESSSESSSDSWPESWPSSPVLTGNATGRGVTGPEGGRPVVGEGRPPSPSFSDEEGFAGGGGEGGACGGGLLAGGCSTVRVVVELVGGGLGGFVDAGVEVGTGGGVDAGRSSSSVSLTII